MYDNSIVIVTMVAAEFAVCQEKPLAFLLCDLIHSGEQPYEVGAILSSFLKVRKLMNQGAETLPQVICLARSVAVTAK